MVTTILGRKLGMTQVWSDDDRLLPVTVIQAGPCVVTQVKTLKRDGYRAVQIGFGEIKESKVNKPMAGHFAKGKVEALTQSEMQKLTGGLNLPAGLKLPF